MRRNKLKFAAKVFALLIMLSTFSSCSKKGVGCPNNFKVVPTININIF